MDSFKIGDIVSRKSYGMDIIFKIVDIYEIDKKSHALLRGIDIRIKADAPLDDLQLVDNENISSIQDRMTKLLDRSVEQSLALYTRNQSNNNLRYNNNTYRDSNSNTFKRPGTILHLDGDKDFVDQCQNHYNKVGVMATVRYIPEEKQSAVVYDLLTQYSPDILVLTGHDGMLKGSEDMRNISSYRNSQYFIKSVKEARRYEPNLDNLVIYAGACQSHYEAIINGGANFASSPSRVFINVFDPVVIAEQIALTPINRLISVDSVVSQTTKGFNGIGGLQTNGKYREGAPKLIY